MQYKSIIHVVNGSAMNLEFIEDGRMDFVCTHPPYANIIKYSNGIAEDISLLEVNEFVEKMKVVARNPSEY